MPKFVPQRSSRRRYASKPALTGGKHNLYARLPWRGAKEIIDWILEGISIFNRKKPLAENTLRRIFDGLFKYSLAPFIVGAGGTTGQPPRDVEEPLNTILVKNSQGVVSSYVVNMKGANVAQSRSTDDPLFTKTTKDRQFLVNPYIVPTNHGTGDTRFYSTNDPMRTTCASVDAFGGCRAVRLQYGAHRKRRRFDVQGNRAADSDRSR